MCRAISAAFVAAEDGEHYVNTGDSTAPTTRSCRPSPRRSPTTMIS
jgi:hypothetical protein